MEENVHNYYLQVALDFGLPGLAVWLLLVMYILGNSKVLRSPDPFGTYLVLYLAGSLFQFRGAEPLFWYVLGLFVASRRRSGRVSWYAVRRSSNTSLPGPGRS
jgi:O-antigen ligase